MYQLSKMKRNKATDSPTRKARARAMFLLRLSASSTRPFRNMKTPALAKAPSTETKSKTMKIFIAVDYPRQALG